MQLPVWCACGRVVTSPGEDRCEECWANDQERYRYNRHAHVLENIEERLDDVAPRRAHRMNHAPRQRFDRAAE